MTAPKGKSKKTPKKGAGKSTVDRLTNKQWALINFLLDPLNRMKPVEQICRELGIDKGTYYDAFKKPHFVEKYKELSVSVALRHVGPVMNSVAKEAVRGSLGHQELILQMAGVIPGKGKGVEVTTNGDGSVKVKVDLL